MENRDIVLIVGGSIALAMASIVLAIYGIRKMNNILNDKVRSIIKCTADYEEVDDLEEVKSEDGVKEESDGEHNTLEVSYEILDNLWKDVNELQIGGEETKRKIEKLEKSDEEMDKRIKKLQKAEIERSRELDELKKSSE